MRKILLSFLFMLFALYSYAQPSVQWEKAYGGYGDDVFNDSKQTPDGGYVFIGTTTSVGGDVQGHHAKDNYGNSDIWVVKTNSMGTIEWARTYGSDSIDKGFAIDVAADGGYIFVGAKMIVTGEDQNQLVHINEWLVKLDKSGNLEWERNSKNAAFYYGGPLKTTADGGCLYGSGYQHEGYLLTKTDAKGDVSWQKYLQAGESLSFSSINTTRKGDFILCGRVRGVGRDVKKVFSGLEDMWLVRLDRKGNVLWEEIFGDTKSDFGGEAIETFEGGFVAVGLTETANYQRYGYVIKTDANGKLQWQKTFPVTTYAGFNNVALLPSGNYVMTGTYEGIMWIAELYADGTMKWESKNTRGLCNDIVVSNDGGYVLCGIVGDSTIQGYRGYGDAWVMKLASTVSIDKVKSIAYSKVYPTLTDGNINVELSDHTSGATINIVNTSSQLIYSAQLHEPKTTFSFAGYPAGVYILSITRKDSKETHKIVYTSR